MRSVVVVLPASMCAMMPMLRVFSRECFLAMTSVLLAASGCCASFYCCSSSPNTAGVLVWLRGPPLDSAPARVQPGGWEHCRVSPSPLRPLPGGGQREPPLPAVVGESLVGFGHPVGVLLLLDRGAAVVGGIEQLVGEAQLHRLLAPALRAADQPPHRERRLARRPYLDGHLVGRATDAPRLHLDARLDVLDRLLEDLDRVFLGALPDDVHRLVEDLLGDRLLPLPHDVVDEQIFYQAM